MKAIYYSQYGSPDVLHIQEVEQPVIGETDVLIKVHATSVNYGDLAARNFKNIKSRQFNMPFLIWVMAKFSFGLNKPNNHILGSEFSGVVEKTGSHVTKFKAGDAVFGYLGQKMGAYAEYIKASQDEVMTLKPANTTFEEAAVLPYGTVMAINLLRKAGLQKGQKVLIIGASGGMGSAAVQIARDMGTEVTGVCGTNSVDYVKLLGATRVIDYTREDYTQPSETYDLIFDVLGRGDPTRCRKILNPGGIHLCASFKMKQLIQMFLSSRSDKKLICAIAPGSLEDLLTIKEWIEAGKIKAIVDKVFPMEQAAEAHRYVESDGRKGKVAISIAHVSF